MRILENTKDTLIIEEDNSTWIMIAGFLLVIGAVFTTMGWTQGDWLFGLIGILCLIAGPWAWITARTITHRFERARRVITIEVKRRWRSDRRELPFDDIADIVLEEIGVGVRTRLSYYVHYLTTQGEVIKWCKTYDGSKENTVECFGTAREFLGMAPAGATQTSTIS